MTNIDIYKIAEEMSNIMKIEDENDREYVRGLLDGMKIYSVFIGEFTKHKTNLHDALEKDKFGEKSNSHSEQAS